MPPGPRALPPDPLLQQHKVVFKNSCNYPVYLASVAPLTQTGISHQNIENQLVMPGTTYVEDLWREPYPVAGGVSFKVKDTPGPPTGAILQFEYTQAHGDGAVWYNLSFINCVQSGVNAADCVGHAEGVRAFSGPACAKWKCLPNEHCAKTAYYLPEYEYKPNPPVGMCTYEALGFEICSKG